MAGMTNYLRNKLVDALFRGIAFVPPTTLYFRLTSNIGTASLPGIVLTGTGYASVGLPCTTANWAATNAPGSVVNPSTGVNGTTSNNVLVNFGNAGSAWGVCAGWELWDASTAGNRLFFGEIVDSSGAPSPKTINSGDPVQFPISTTEVIFA
jgi:hypothetical protein